MQQPDRPQQINKEWLSKLKNRPDEGYWLVFEKKVPGFGVRITKTTISFVVQRRIEDRAAPNGSRVVRHKLGVYPDLPPDEARRMAERKIAELAAGVNVNAQARAQEAESVTLEEVWDNYKRTHTSLRPSTIKIYAGALDRCFADWKNTPVTKITRKMVQDRFDKISNANGPKGKGEAHANQAMRFLRSLMNFAAGAYEDADGRSILPENPVRVLSQTRKWNKVRRRQDVVRSSELKAWYNALQKLENDTMRDYLLFILFTGVRRMTAAKLEWSHVDLKEKMFRITAENAKNNEEVLLPLSDFMVEMLRRRMIANRAQSIYVFPTQGSRHSQGGHLVESKSSYKRVAKDAGIEHSRPHTLRRTFLTIAESLGYDSYTLKKLATHTITNDVTGGYLIIEAERLRQPIESIASYLIECCGIVEQKRRSRVRLPNAQRTNKPG